MRSTSVLLRRMLRFGRTGDRVAKSEAAAGSLAGVPGRMNRRSCGARAPAGGWCHGRERGAASALQPGWRVAPRGQAVLEARRFMVGLGCHWATKC
jgi:hypothetical protein